MALLGTNITMCNAKVIQQQIEPLLCIKLADTLEGSQQRLSERPASCLYGARC